MKFHNKFIAVGMAMGLSFTGTYMSYSWFTDSSYKNHSITIGELVEKIEYDFTTDVSILGHGWFENNNELRINIPDQLKPTLYVDSSKNPKLEISEMTGEINKNNLNSSLGGWKDLFPTKAQYIELYIPNNSSPKFSADKFNTSVDGEVDSVNITIVSIEGNKRITNQYKVVITNEKNNHKWKLKAHWRKLSSTVEDLLIEEDTIPEIEGELGTEKPTIPEIPEDSENIQPEVPEIDIPENPSTSQPIEKPTEPEQPIEPESNNSETKEPILEQEEPTPELE